MTRLDFVMLGFLLLAVAIPGYFVIQDWRKRDK